MAEVKVCPHCASVFLPKQRRSVYCPAPDCRRAKWRVIRARPKAKEQKKARQRVYNARPEVKEKRAVYCARPEVKEKRAVYCARPEVKERKVAYFAAYRAALAAKAKAFDELMKMTGVSL